MLLLATYASPVARDVGHSTQLVGQDWAAVFFRAPEALFLMSR
jgi:hypothetical protein